MDKTNYQLITELDKVFTPKDFGAISNAEMQVVKCGLRLDARDGMDLCNLRDMVVMYFHIKALESEVDRMSLIESDKLSAITYVIDCAKAERGLEP
jgi:hypothetical protein